MGMTRIGGGNPIFPLTNTYKMISHLFFFFKIAFSPKRIQKEGISIPLLIIQRRGFGFSTHASIRNPLPVIIVIVNTPFVASRHSQHPSVVIQGLAPFVEADAVCTLAVHLKHDVRFSESIILHDLISRTQVHSVLERPGALGRLLV